MIRSYIRYCERQAMLWVRHPWKMFFLNIVAYAAMMGIFRVWCAHVDRKNTEFDHSMSMLKQQHLAREVLSKPFAFASEEPV